jgi:glycerol-3-phosphate dehydrogenase
MIHDVVIIGGGIVGAGVFRDLALHGLDVLLVDKGDFAAQTSQGSSKMLHGGVRYLENFDFALVQEALEEKNLWLKLAPHLAVEKEFHLPVYQGAKWPLPFVRLGLFLYDLLSHFQNRPAGHTDVARTLERFPQLNPRGLTGAGTYHDGVVDDHKLALECLWDGEEEERARAISHAEVVAIHQGPVIRLSLRDRLDGRTWDVETRHVVFATGPFTDELMRTWNIPWDPVLLLSKGVHLWIRPEALTLHGPLLLPTPDNRVVFVIPQRGAILVGTTETPVEEEMFDIRATPADVDYLLGVLGEFFPGAGVGHQHIISSFAAVRPLVREPGADRGKTSRLHRVFRPAPNMHALLGGKYTTFRRMAQDVCREIVPRFGVAYNPNVTLNPLRRPSVVGTFQNQEVDESSIERIIRDERPRTMEDLIHRRLSWLRDWTEYGELAGRPRAYWEERLRAAHPTD